MAPEYLIRGQLTEKADVYSFGVLVLEIVCGRKNITFTEDSGSLLQTVRLVAELFLESKLYICGTNLLYFIIFCFLESDLEAVQEP